MFIYYIYNRYVITYLEFKDDCFNKFIKNRLNGCPNLFIACIFPLFKDHQVEPLKKKALTYVKAYCY